MIEAPNRVAELREKRGWTQRQLADLAGLTDQTISNLENARRKPSLETALAVAGAFGLPVESVFLAGASTADVEHTDRQDGTPATGSAPSSLVGAGEQPEVVDNSEPVL